jgi:hypothetical protein
MDLLLETMAETILAGRTAFRHPLFLLKSSFDCPFQQLSYGIFWFSDDPFTGEDKVEVPPY